MHVCMHVCGLVNSEACLAAHRQAGWRGCCCQGLPKITGTSLCCLSGGGATSQSVLLQKTKGVAMLQGAQQASMLQKNPAQRATLLGTQDEPHQGSCYTHLQCQNVWAVRGQLASKARPPAAPLAEGLGAVGLGPTRCGGTVWACVSHAVQHYYCRTKKVSKLSRQQ